MSSGITIFAVHVSNITFISSSRNESNQYKAELWGHWDISDLGAIKYTLGISITWDRNNRTIKLSPTALTDRIIEQFGQRDAHPLVTPMVTGLEIIRPDMEMPIASNITEWMARTPYRSLVSSLN